MRRLLRRSLLVLCTLLLPGVAVLWGIGQRREQHSCYSSPSGAEPDVRITRIDLVVCTGALRLTAGSLQAYHDVEGEGAIRHYSFPPSESAWHRDLRLTLKGWQSVRRFLGFAFKYRRQSRIPYDIDDGPSVLIEAPYWFLMAVCSIPPALWLRRYRQRRVRKRRGLCVACGYDLRASPDRCPECGTPVEQPLGPRP